MKGKDRFRPPLAVVTAGLVIAVALAGSAVTGAVPDAGSRTCEYGITMALSWEFATAESAFTALLSRPGGEARALNNLGNIHRLQGDPELALAFYTRAVAADTNDPGIRLNQAAALLLVGDEEAATRCAADGIRRAGGPGPAADLLGLALGDTTESSRGADRARMNREDVRRLLQAAVRSVPVDTLVASSAGDSTMRAPAERPAWRSAGARASDGADRDAFVYWKR